MTTPLALPEVMDPMYWLGDGGLFGSAVLVGVLVIVFIETGLLFPFLPGDTLLFTAGLIAAQPHSTVDLWSVAPCAAIAAVLGGQVSYGLGRRLGPALFGKPDARFVKQRYLTHSHEFFGRHGPKALVIAPFIGVVRTFTPVVAGVAGMHYRVFLVFNIIGCLAWGIGLTTVGYFLGNVDFVARHLELMVIGIAVLSTLPVVAAAAKAFTARRAPDER
ncbi:DedA family protein [soil metagenome]